MKTSHNPILDPVIQKSVENFHKSQSQETVKLEDWDNNLYTSTFKNWIKSSSYNSVSGLEHFKYESYCVGALDAITNFVHRHVSTKRIRFSQAEFIASKIATNHAKGTFVFLEDDDLKEGDALILSLPFGGSGSVHPDYDFFINECNNKNIPVLIDMAYFAISYDIHVDLSAECITDVVFSLSKCFNTSLRLGYRLTKQFHDDLIQCNHDLKLVNRWAINTGTMLLDAYSHDWLVEKFKPIQHSVCSDLNLMPSNTFTLAVGNTYDHAEFQRYGYIRVCITDEIHQRL